MGENRNQIVCHAQYQHALPRWFDSLFQRPTKSKNQEPYQQKKAFEDFNCHPAFEIAEFLNRPHN